MDALVDNILQMHAHSGPAFAKWRRGMAACVGALLLDELETAMQTRD
jgi:hypothetical protein